MLKGFFFGFLGHERVRELDVPLVVHPLKWFFCLRGHESFHFVPCFLTFFGCFGLFMIGIIFLAWVPFRRKGYLCGIASDT